MQNKKQKLKTKKYPSFNEELKCWRRGYRVVVGLDEAGRGPLAGPVVAGAICIATSFVWSRRHLFSLSGAHTSPTPRSLIFSLLGRSKIKGSSRRPSFKKMPPVPSCQLRDSKKLSAGQREEWYKILTGHPDIKWGIGIVSEKVIDKINIFEATKLAMKKAVADIMKNYRMVCDRESSDNLSKRNKVDFLILDGNFTLDDLNINQMAIIKADEKVFSCAAASVIAKVTRDRIMLRYAKRYPQYGFERHRGYGTRMHFEALKKYGSCKIHRKSFRLIANLAKLKLI